MMMFNPEIQRDPNSPFGTNGSFFLINPSESTGLRVLFQRYHEFSDGESRASFEQERRQRAVGANMHLISAKEEWSDSGAVFNYIVGDEGSIRRYAHTVVLHNKSCYTLIATYDSVFGLPSWVQHAMESFQSTDKVFPYPHFQTRDNAYFDALLSNDSIARKKALDITSEMDFTAASAERIRSVVDLLSGFSTEERQMIVSKLIEGLAADTSKASIEFLSREFLAHSDSMEYQEALLTVLLRMKTPQAWKAYRTLVLEEPTIAIDPWNASCWILLDSVKLAVPLLSDLRQLLAIDEYREPIYRLMAQAMDSGWYKADDYAQLLPQILLEARNELKRLNANIETGYAFNTSNLLDFASLLQPFRKRKEVDAFFKKAQATKRTQLLLDLVAFDLEHDQPVADSLIQKIARNDEFVHELYNVLHHHGQTARMPSGYTSRLDLLAAYLRRIETLEFVGVADSVAIDSLFSSSIMAIPLEVYFCRVYNEEFNQWFGKVIAFDASEKDNWWPMFIESDLTVFYGGESEAEKLQSEFQYLEELNREFVSFGYGGMDFTLKQY
jgi:hypothetical protein